jgi:hypothetical protein
VITLPSVKSLVSESKEAIEQAIETLRAARGLAEEIKEGIEIPPRGFERDRMERLDRRSTLVEFNHSALKLERTLSRILARRFKEIEGFPLKQFASWDDSGARDEQEQMKVDEGLGK